MKLNVFKILKNNGYEIILCDDEEFCTTNKIPGMFICKCDIEDKNSIFQAIMSMKIEDIHKFINELKDKDVDNEMLIDSINLAKRLYELATETLNIEILKAEAEEMKRAVGGSGEINVVGLKVRATRRYPFMTQSFEFNQDGEMFEASIHVEDEYSDVIKCPYEIPENDIIGFALFIKEAGIRNRPYLKKNVSKLFNEYMHQKE